MSVTSLPPCLSPTRLSRYAGGLALCVIGALAGAQPNGNAPTNGVYTCSDAQGRRLTSDRPIMACIDREQREIGRSGAVRRVIPPTLTAAERDAREALEREAAIERQRVHEAQQRDRALAARYPNQAVLEASRKDALAQTQAVVDTAQQRIAELTRDRKKLDGEMEFYRGNPSRAPASLRHAIEDIEQELQAQRRAIASQQDERDRINARFDEQAGRLRPLWEARTAAAQDNVVDPSLRQRR
jgi:chromosome segregation ATPase